MGKKCGKFKFFQKVSTKISIILKKHSYLDLSRWSRLVLTISIKILTQPSLNWKVSILKISMEKKKSWSRHDGHSRRFSKVSLDVLDLDWSRLSRPPCLQKVLWLTVHTIEGWIEKRFIPLADLEDDSAEFLVCKSPKERSTCGTKSRPDLSWHTRRCSLRPKDDLAFILLGNW